MAASVVKRDTDGARNGHDKPGRQQVKPDRSSLRKYLHHFQPDRRTTGKRHRSAQDEEEDEDTTEHRRKSRRIQEKSDQHPPQNPVASAKASRKSPRLQEKQAANQQRIAKGGQSRPLQRPAVKKYNRRKEKDKDPATSPADLGAHKSTKRRRCANTEDELNHDAKRPRRGLPQHTEATTGPDKENFIENWLDESCWSRRTSTENESPLLEPPVNMPRKPATVLPSPGNSFESTISTSKKSEKSAASVHDTDYHQSLRYRNIFIERENPPPELMRRAHRITSRSRTSPEMDDATIQKLKDKSRRLRNEAEEEIIQQLAPRIIPAMDEIPDQKLARNADQLWYNSVPVPLDSSILTNPLPLPKPKPDLAFGYSEAAFTRNQLGTIDLLVGDQFGQSYAVPDQKVRFPFLQIEFKSQAKNGTHYMATNQAAGAGAIALNGNLELMQRSFGLEKFDYEEPRYFSVTIDHQFACVNVHWLRAPAEKGGQHSFHVEGLSQHLLRDTNGIRALSRAIKNILDNGADARLRTLCEALDAYRRTVVRNRNAANVQREQQPEYQPESHTGQQGRRGMPAPEVQAGLVASHDELRTSRPPLESVHPVHTRQRGRRGMPAPEVQAGVVASHDELRTNRPPLESVHPVHTRQRGRRGAPAPEVQVGVVASYEEVRTSRPPLEPFQPVHTEQRSRRGAPAPEVQVGEDIFDRRKVRIGRAPPEPLQPLYTEKRPRRVPTTTRRQVHNPSKFPPR